MFVNRNRRIQRLYATLVTTAILLIGTSCASTDARRQLLPGSAVPQYAAPTLTGEVVSLESLRGKVVLLNLWATWCAPCRQETPFLQAKFDEYRERGFEIVGASMDTPGATEAIEEFIAEYGVTYTILHDSESVGLGLFRVIGLPATFLIDRDGKLRWFRYGPIIETNQEFIMAIEDALLQGDF